MAKKNVNIQAIRGKNVTIVSNKNLKPSSKDWLKRHLNDRFVAQAKIDGYLSRAAYKLIEIIEEFDILPRLKGHGDVNIVDLGCAPGSWSQVILKKVPNARLVMVDLLPLEEELQGDNNIQVVGDFTDPAIQSEIIDFFYQEKIHLIVCDIAPNISGERVTDMLIMQGIMESIVDFAWKNLANNGHLVMKIFHAALTSELHLSIKKSFQGVKIFKPEASRSTSSEVYIVCNKFIKK